MKNALIQFVEDQVQVKDFPQFKAGDTITVTYKIVEGNKERLQKFQGVVLQRASEGSHATFTVRKISSPSRASFSRSYACGRGFPRASGACPQPCTAE